MSNVIRGRIFRIMPVQQVTDKFKKREFVLELIEEINGQVYTNFAKMQLIQAKCDIMDRFQPGHWVDVTFNVRGNRYEKDGKEGFATNLDAWKVEAVPMQQQQNIPNQSLYTPPQQQYQQPNYPPQGGYAPQYAPLPQTPMQPAPQYQQPAQQQYPPQQAQQPQQAPPSQNAQYAAQPGAGGGTIYGPAQQQPQPNGPTYQPQQQYPAYPQQPAAPWQPSAVDDLPF